MAQQVVARAPWFSVILATKVLLVAALAHALFWYVLAYMASDWWNYDAYSQRMLLPPFALYIAWLQRRRILSLPAAYDWRGGAVDRR